MMHKEVPIAFLNFKRRKKIKTGTIIKPPPAPTNPVITPTTIPSRITKGKPKGLRANSSHFTSLVLFGFLLRIMLSEELRIRTANRTIISASFEMLKLSR